MQNETINNLGEVKPVVLIGGKTGKFVPNLNMSFFDDEFFINLNRKDKIITDAVAEIKDYKTVLNGIDNDIFHVNENGDFKWDILIPEKPKYNFFKWEIKSKGVEFYYQAELTEKEISDGHVRPDEVVGSYAVYCSKSNNKYKTGKVCHIYRPLCIDANGLKAYADLNIDSKANTLTITIPQDYIDNAIYPMTLDPTFGYTSVGASGTHVDGYAFACKFTGAAGTATSLSAYVTSATSKNWKYALFSNNSNTLTLISGTAEGSGVASGWSELSLSTASTITESSYALVIQGVDTTVYFYYDSGGDDGQQGYKDRTYSSAWASPETWAFPNSNILSVYCTYSTGESANSYYYQQMQM
jgi:hypothetical protein